MAYTRRPRGYWEEAWIAGQSMAAKLLAHALIDFAAWRRREVFEAGSVVVLEPGDSLFSLAELADLISASTKQIRTAREDLRQAAFCSFQVATESTRSRTLYRVREWWRFVEVGKADENGPTGAPPESGAQSGHSRKAGKNRPSQYTDTNGGHSEGTVRAQWPSRSSRPNKQSSEHIATEQIRDDPDVGRRKEKEIRDDPDRCTREVESEAEFERHFRRITPEDWENRKRTAIAQLEQLCKDNGEPWAEIGSGGRNGGS